MSGDLHGTIDPSDELARPLSLWSRYCLASSICKEESMEGASLTKEQITIVHDFPARPFERFAGFKPFQRALDADEELLIELWNGRMNYKTGIDHESPSVTAETT